MTESIENITSLCNFLEDQTKRLDDIIKEKDIKIKLLEEEITKLKQTENINSYQGFQEKQITQSIIESMNNKFEIEKKDWTQEIIKLKNEISELKKK